MNPRDAYLIGYNSLQVLLWTIVLYRIFETVVASAAVSTSTALPVANFAQTIAWLETLHAVLGLGGKPSTAFIQSLGRYVVLHYLITPTTFTHDLFVTATLLISWSIADVVRYTFYITSVFGKTPYVLLWLRYSLFYILYPIGIASEWLEYYITLDHVDRTNMYAIRLPNAYNFAFDFGVWNRIVLFLYLYFGPHMFFHMLRQRATKLGPKT